MIWIVESPCLECGKRQMAMKCPPDCEGHDPQLVRWIIESSRCRCGGRLAAATEGKRN